jgi:predicted DNA-binding transcriptional regulator AlpA
VNRPYYAADVAHALGITLEHFYRVREQLVAVDGMPPPIRKRGRLTWARAAFDQWHDPRTRALKPANDAGPLAPTLEQARAELARHYGGN